MDQLKADRAGRGRIAVAVAALVGTLAVSGAPPGARAAAQTPAPSVGLSFGLDTTVAPTGAIVRLVRAYLAAPDSSAARRGLWSTADPLDRRLGDLAANFAYQGFPATVIGVLATDRGDSVYVVKLIHATADSAGPRVMPLAVQRLYAVRALGSPRGWQLAGALPRLTRVWTRRTVGRLEFRYAPDQRPDPARAAQAARFVDSVAALFAVPAPTRVTVVVAASPDAYFRALGLDFFILPDGPGPGTGGQGGLVPGTSESLVLAGDPSQGEAYLHEIAHVVLAGRLGARRTIAEGVATWLGGSRGRPPAALYADLAAYQRAHPDLTLAALLGDLSGGPGEQARDAAQYATGALLVTGSTAGTASPGSARSAPPRTRCRRCCGLPPSSWGSRRPLRRRSTTGGAPRRRRSACRPRADGRPPQAHCSGRGSPAETRASRRPPPSIRRGFRQQCPSVSASGSVRWGDSRSLGCDLHACLRRIAPRARAACDRREAPGRSRPGGMISVPLKDRQAWDRGAQAGAEISCSAGARIRRWVPRFPRGAPCWSATPACPPPSSRSRSSRTP
jgi:hypothetical protein